MTIQWWLLLCCQYSRSIKTYAWWTKKVYCDTYPFSQIQLPRIDAPTNPFHTSWHAISHDCTHCILQWQGQHKQHLILPEKIRFGSKNILGGANDLKRYLLLYKTCFHLALHRTNAVTWSIQQHFYTATGFSLSAWYVVCSCDNIPFSFARLQQVSLLTWLHVVNRRLVPSSCHLNQVSSTWEQSWHTIETRVLSTITCGGYLFVPSSLFTVIFAVFLTLLVIHGDHCQATGQLRDNSVNEK